jgi:hypothetical protein
VPGVVTLIEEEFSPLLHNSVPVVPVAVSVELSQLLVTVTDGAGGVVIGEATPVPAGLLHPLTVWVTV